MGLVGNCKLRQSYYDKFGVKLTEQKKLWKRLNPKLPEPQALRKNKFDGRPTFSFGAGVSATVQLQADRRLKASTLWIAASRAEAKGLRLFLDHPEIVVMPYALSPRLDVAFAQIGRPSWQSRKARFFARYGIDRAMPLLFFSGRISPLKGLAQFARELERIQRPCQLIVTGYWEKLPGYPDFKKTLSKSRFLRLIDLGLISRRENFEIMSFCDGVLSLSVDVTEEFGFLAREALFLGVPVLVTSWGGLNDLSLTEQICRVSVRLDETLKPKPIFGKSQLNAWLALLGRITPQMRKQRGEKFQRRYESELRASARRLAAALRRRQKLKTASIEPIRFTPLSAEITLDAVKKGMFNANSDVSPRILYYVLNGNSKNQQGNGDD